MKGHHPETASDLVRYAQYFKDDAEAMYGKATPGLAMDKPDALGDTKLHHAIEEGNLETIKEVLLFFIAFVILYPLYYTRCTPCTSIHLYMYL